MRFYSRKYALAALAALSLPVLTGCVDDSYDLENIDETIRVEIKDLVVPLNLKPVEFSSVIDLTDEECVEINDNGEYVLVKSGTFTEAVNIKSISADPVISNSLRISNIPVVSGVSVPVPDEEYSFSYSDYADEYIVDIESGKVDFDMSFVINLKDAMTGRALDCSVSDMKFSLPKGFYGYYETNGGTVAVQPGMAAVAEFPGETLPDASGNVVFTYHITDINTADAGISFVNSHFNYSGTIGTLGGHITPRESAGNQSGSLTLELRLGHLEVKSITGTVDYVFTDIERQHIELNDLPDVLRDPETRIGLRNPQVYIDLNNPMARYGFTGSTGVTISQVRPVGEQILTASLTNRLNIASEPGRQKYMLAPYPDKVTPVAGYENASTLTLAGLDEILYGNGLPQGLNIDFATPKLNRRRVENLDLGVDVGELVGEYKFYAPLDFTSGSQVIYSEDQQGWDIGGDEDFEISALSISAHLLSDLPVAIELSALPLDADGNVIRHDGEDVTVTVDPAVIPAHADTDITIMLNGSIRGLDGIRYTIRLAAGEDSSTLRPDMNLNLTNIRAKISGYYESEDSDDSYDYDE